MSCTLAAAFFQAASGQGLSPQGGEYSISGALAGDQVYPAVGLNSSGGFLLWQDHKIDTNGQGIAALRLDGSLLGVGEPFRVNQEQRGQQQHPQVAIMADGGAAVIWDGAWKDKKGKGTNGIFARFLDAAGGFKTGDILVSQYSRRILTNYSIKLPGYKNNKMAKRTFRFSESARVYRGQNDGATVAALPDGGAVVAYSGLRHSVSNYQHIVREVKVIRGKSYTNDVVRGGTTAGSWKKDVFFQRFDAAGNKAGGEVLVNQFAYLDQQQPALAALPNGNFVVAYASERSLLNLSTLIISTPGRVAPTARADIYARLFDASGVPLGPEFPVNTTNLPCASPSVAAGTDGAFTIAWTQADAHAVNGLDVYARTFNADGSSSFDAFRANAYRPGSQHTPHVAALGAVQLVIWTSRGQDGSREGVFGRLVSGGVPAGDEFQVNTVSAGPQIHPVVATDGVNRFLTVWSGFELDSMFDLFAQAFVVTQPASAGAGLAEQNQKRGSVAVVSPGGATSSAAPGGLAAAVGAAGTAGSPRLLLSRQAESLRLQWSAQAGARYQVERSTDLRVWSPMGGPRTVDGESDALEVDSREGGAVFFRVLRLP